MIGQLEFYNNFNNSIQELIIDPSTNIFVSNKEILDLELSCKKEINGLITQGVFEFIHYDPETMAKYRIFESRLVNEIKGKGTLVLSEKSRLVIQAYNDEYKTEILTQSPTIQRSGQRLLIARAP